jgi:hypothetical protein
MFGDNVIKVLPHVAFEFLLKGHHIRPAIELKVVHRVIGVSLAQIIEILLPERLSEFDHAGNDILAVIGIRHGAEIEEIIAPEPRQDAA